MSATSAEESIIKTLVYFDQLGIPLALPEAHRYLMNSHSEMLMSELWVELESSRLKKVIASQGGYFFLAGQEKLIDLRSERVQVSFDKWKIIKRAVKLLRYIPFIRMIVLANTAAIDAADEDSDLDLLIIVKEGKMWTARLFITALMQITGLRRHGQKIANRICLSFYLTDNNLSLERFALPEDPHYACWVGMLAPIFATDESLVSKFESENNWIKKYLPNHFFKRFSQVRWLKDVGVTRVIRGAGEWLFNGYFGKLIEERLKNMQLKKIYAHPDSRVHRVGLDVVVNDEVLKFHESDTRQILREEWEKRVKELLSIINV